MDLSLAYLAIIAAFFYGIFHYVTWHFRRRRLYELALKFDGPLSLPFVGSAYVLAGKFEQTLNKLVRLIDSYPSPFRLWLGPRLIICVSDPQHIKTICLSPNTLEKSDIMDVSRPLIGTALITAPVPMWKVHRRLMQPIFNQKILDSFVEVFTAQSKILTEQMERHLDGPEFEIFDLLFACTLDIICESTFGKNLGIQEKKYPYYLETLERVSSIISKRFFFFWLHPDFVFYRTQLGRDQQKCIKYLHGVCENIIQMRKQTNSTKSSSQPDDSIPRKKAFLDHLMQLPDDGVGWSDEELIYELQTLIVAGHDTNAFTCTYAMLMLTHHRDIQDKVYEELYEIFGDDDIEERPVTPKDLPRMKYLERVIKESMRLFPMAPYLIRTVTEDLDIGSHILPKDSSVLLAVINLHRNEKYWPDPFKFDPDRFLPEEVDKRHPYSFMGFSGGPRNCVGFNFATMTMKTILATILRKYIVKKDNIVPIKDIQLKMDFLLKPIEPIKIKIAKRTRT